MPLLGGNISVYRRVVAASGLANLGDGVRQVALPLLAAAITQDAALVAGLTAIAYVPWMLLGLPIGALVDRSRPELFVLGAAVARGVLFGVLTLTLVLDVRSMLLLYVSMTAAPLGALAGGGLAAALDLRAPLWVSGLAMVVITGLFVVATRDVVAVHDRP